MIYFNKQAQMLRFIWILEVFSINNLQSFPHLFIWVFAKWVILSFDTPSRPPRWLSVEFCAVFKLNPFVETWRQPFSTESLLMALRPRNRYISWSQRCLHQPGSSRSSEWIGRHPWPTYNNLFDLLDMLCFLDSKTKIMFF